MGFGIVIVVRLFCQLWRQRKDGGREFEEIEENLILIIVGEERCREFREFDRLDREVFNLVESCYRLDFYYENIN